MYMCILLAKKLQFEMYITDRMKKWSVNMFFFFNSYRTGEKKNIHFLHFLQ